MKLDTSQFANEPMRPISFYAPESVSKAVDAAAAKLDPSSPNRSAFLRSAVLSALQKDARS